MRNFKLIIWAILLAVTLLNFDYSIFENFQFNRNNVTKIITIVICVVAIIFHFVKKPKEENAS